MDELKITHGYTVIATSIRNGSPFEFLEYFSGCSLCWYQGPVLQITATRTGKCVFKYEKLGFEIFASWEMFFMIQGISVGNKSIENPFGVCLKTFNMYTPLRPAAFKTPSRALFRLFCQQPDICHRLAIFSQSVATHSICRMCRDILQTIYQPSVNLSDISERYTTLINRQWDTKS
jgi:hypothetical protein